MQAPGSGGTPPPGAIRGLQRHRTGEAARAATAGPAANPVRYSPVAEFSARRVVAVAAVAGALVGGAVAGGVAAASSSANGDSPASSSGGTGSVATAAVVRTTLTNTVQVGGSIGYGGSYTIAAPSGTSAQQLATAQQTVTRTSNPSPPTRQAESDATTADDQATAAAETNVNNATATLDSDQASEAQACAGKGASAPACSQDAQKVSQDQLAVDRGRPAACRRPVERYA